MKFVLGGVKWFLTLLGVWLLIAIVINKASRLKGGKDLKDLLKRKMEATQNQNGHGGGIKEKTKTAETVLGILKGTNGHKRTVKGA